MLIDFFLAGSSGAYLRGEHLDRAPTLLAILYGAGSKPWGNTLAFLCHIVDK
jgi:hypothetical protein